MWDLNKYLPFAHTVYVPCITAAYCLLYKRRLGGQTETHTHTITPPMAANKTLEQAEMGWVEDGGVVFFFWGGGGGLTCKRSDPKFLTPRPAEKSVRLGSLFP